MHVLGASICKIVAKKVIKNKKLVNKGYNQITSTYHDLQP